MNKKKENKKFEWNKDNILAIVGIVFFVILAIFARFSSGSSNNNLEQGGGNVSPTPTPTENTEEINLETNYHFTYTVDINGQKEVIDGSVTGSKARFQILGAQKEEYLKLSNTIMKLVDGSYQVLEAKTIRDYFVYLDLNNIKKLMSISMVEMDEDDLYLYEVETTDLFDQFTSVKYDDFTEYPTNKLEVSYTKKGYFKKIVLDYSNYYTSLKGVSSKFLVTMEFEDYGKQEEIDT